MTALLLVEDDPALGATLRDRLAQESYQVTWATNQGQAQDHLKKSKYDLIILDVGLPDGNGFDLAAHLRASHDSTPFLFLTALNSAEHRLQGFELGASDFIPKPFHLRELLLRIGRLVTASPKLANYTSADLKVDFGAMQIIFASGEVEHPAARDFKLLQVLIEAAPNVVSREEVMKLIVSPNSEDQLPTERTIDNSVLRLRQMLRRTGKEHIRSVRGIGYQWLG